jgi:hypothetical protein
MLSSGPAVGKASEASQNQFATRAAGLNQRVCLFEIRGVNLAQSFRQRGTDQTCIY